MSTRWASCCDDLLLIPAPYEERRLINSPWGSPWAVDMRELENYLHLLINNEALRNRWRNNLKPCLSLLQLQGRGKTV